MAEYIEREAVLERIDGIWDCADMVFEPNDKCCRTDDCASCEWRETKNAIRKIVAYIPAADVRPVVVCANCEHNNHCLTQEFVDDCGKIPLDRNTFFCADGERKDGDGE